MCPLWRHNGYSLLHETKNHQKQYRTYALPKIIFNFVCKQCNNNRIFCRVVFCSSTNVFVVVVLFLCRMSCYIIILLYILITTRKKNVGCLIFVLKETNAADGILLEINMQSRKYFRKSRWFAYHCFESTLRVKILC